VEIEAIGTRVMIKRASAVLKNEGFSELFVRANVKYNPMTKPFLRRYAVNPETCKTTTDDVARGSIRLAKSKLFSNVDNEAKLVAWNGREMMTLDQPYDSKLIATIRSKFEDAIKSGKHIDTNKYNGEVYSEAIRSYSHGGGPIFDFGSQIPEIANLVNNTSVLRALRGYYGGNFAPTWIKIYRNYHIPPRIFEGEEDVGEVFSSFWHCDGQQIDGIKLFVTLDRVTDDHGPLHVVSRKATREIYDLDSTRTQDGVAQSIVEEHGDTITHTGPPGTAMLANTNLCLHRAGYPVRGNFRDLVQIQFRASTKPLATDWLVNPEYPLERHQTV